MLNSRIAIIELILAALFWGWGYVAMKWALVDFSFAEITFIRFMGAFLLMAPRFHFKTHSSNALLAFWPGLFLGATLLLQTAGLLYTTATKSAFISTLYALFVPIIGIVLDKKFPTLLFLIALALTLLGSALLVELQAGLIGVGPGELLTLGGALAAALQIYLIGYISKKIERPFVFNLWCCFWTGLIAFALLNFLPDHGWFNFISNVKQASAQSWFALLSMILFSTIAAFYWQVKNQKIISANLASLIFLMESPFAFLLAKQFLGETVSLYQLFGMYLILMGVSLAVLKGQPPSFGKETGK